MTTDALGTAGGVSAQDHRLAIASTIAGLSTGILDVRTGVFPGPNSLTLLTGTSTTAPMTVSVAAFQAVTARTSASGAYLGPTLEAPTTVNIAAAPGANSRIDVVWVKQQDADATVPTPDGTTAPLVSVTAGTAAASPTKPTIPVGALELGTVTVAAGATSTNGAGVTIANTARQTTSRGGIVPARAGDVTPGAFDGQYRDNPSWGWIERWSSVLAGWYRPNVPDGGWVNLSINSPFVTTANGCRYRVKDGICYWHVDITRPTAWSPTINGWTFPAGARPAFNIFQAAYKTGSGGAVARLGIATTGVATFYDATGAGGDGYEASGAFPVD